jgi:hypothetical protein
VSLTVGKREKSGRCGGRKFSTHTAHARPSLFAYQIK